MVHICPLLFSKARLRVPYFLLTLDDLHRNNFQNMTPWPYQTHTPYVIRMEKLRLKRVEVIDFSEMLSIATCWSQARPLHLTFLAIHFLWDGEISLWRGISDVSCACVWCVAPFSHLNVSLALVHLLNMTEAPYATENKELFEKQAVLAASEKNVSLEWTNVS